jgi:hypothetical protein
LLNPRRRELASPGMKHNVGTPDRIVRVLVGLAMLACSVLLPLPLAVRVAVLGATGGYLVVSSLVGSCLGYTLIGRTTGPLEERR